MSQMSFSDVEYAGKRKQTRRERFLAEMDQVVPWKGLLGLIQPFYPKAGGGRKPYPLETMLRIHLLQNWFSLSDPAMEEALYEITPMRQFKRFLPTLDVTKTYIISVSEHWFAVREGERFDKANTHPRTEVFAYIEVQQPSSPA